MPVVCAPPGCCGWLPLWPSGIEGGVEPFCCPLGALPPFCCLPPWPGWLACVPKVTYGCDALRVMPIPALPPAAKTVPPETVIVPSASRA